MYVVHANQRVENNSKALKEGGGGIDIATTVKLQYVCVVPLAKYTILNIVVCVCLLSLQAPARWYLGDKYARICM